MEVIGGSHLAIFFPMPFFRVEPINQVMLDYMDGTKFQDLSFHWIPFSQVVDPHFRQNYISSFNYEIIAYCAEKLIDSAAYHRPAS